MYYACMHVCALFCLCLGVGRWSTSLRNSLPAPSGSAASAVTALLLVEVSMSDVEEASGLSKIQFVALSTSPPCRCSKNHNPKQKNVIKRRSQQLTVALSAFIASSSWKPKETKASIFDWSINEHWSSELLDCLEMGLLMSAQNEYLSEIQWSKKHISNQERTFPEYQGHPCVQAANSLPPLLLYLRC